MKILSQKLSIGNVSLFFNCEMSSKNVLLFAVCENEKGVSVSSLK
jgi:hypothetical protein